MKKLLTTVSIHRHLFFGFIVAFLYANHSGDFTYDPPLLKCTV